MSILSSGDIVWAGHHGDGGRFYAYHIEYNGPPHEVDCYCPTEAVSYLQKIGIKIRKSTAYDSGYAAIGCMFMPSGGVNISPHIKEIYSRQSTNKDLFYLLKKE